MVQVKYTIKDGSSRSGWKYELEEWHDDTDGVFVRANYIEYSGLSCQSKKDYWWYLTSIEEWERKSANGTSYTLLQVEKPKKIELEEKRIIAKSPIFL